MITVFGLISLKFQNSNTLLKDLNLNIKLTTLKKLLFMYHIKNKNKDKLIHYSYMEILMLMFK